MNYFLNKMNCTKKTKMSAWVKTFAQMVCIDMSVCTKYINSCAHQVDNFILFLFFSLPVCRNGVQAWRYGVFALEESRKTI